MSRLTLSYASISSGDRLWPAVRIVLIGWAIASGLELSLYWSMQGFNRWGGTYFPFGLQRPWAEAALAVTTGVGLATVLIGAMLHRPHLVFWGGLVSGLSLVADRGLGTLPNTFAAFVSNFDGTRTNVNGPWYGGRRDLLVLGYRIAQLIPRAAVPVLCILISRRMR